MWGLIAALVEAWGESLQAMRDADWRSRNDDVLLRDWIIRRRLGIPSVWEDIT